MMDDNPKYELVAKVSIVIILCLMVVASIMLLMIMVVQSAYMEFNADTWWGFVVPPALWLGFCGFSIWAITRLKRAIGPTNMAPTFWFAGMCMVAIVGLAVLILFTS